LANDIWCRVKTLFSGDQNRKQVYQKKKTKQVFIAHCYYLHEQIGTRNVPTFSAIIARKPESKRSSRQEELKKFKENTRLKWCKSNYANVASYGEMTATKQQRRAKYNSEMSTVKTKSPETNNNFFFLKKSSGHFAPPEPPRKPSYN